jgi:natural product biosynthesis luciferase-like monooxygenase protein
LDFSVLFFSSDSLSARGATTYNLLKRASLLADACGFIAIWTPERHFDRFGGAFPNPAVTSAALATITNRLELRAGSLISPLHDIVRIVEDWSVVDNISNGRASISFGSGWNANDFVFFPDRYVDRRGIMLDQIGTIQDLWAGKPVCRINGAGQPVEVTTFPRPIRVPLPVWITSSGSPATFGESGRRGYNLLTHLISQDLTVLESKIRRYRSAREAAGFDPMTGKVALMLHTFVGIDLKEVRAKARDPLREYLRSAIVLENRSAQAGGFISGGHRSTQEELDEGLEGELLDLTVERYLDTASLIGTPDTVSGLLTRLARIGVNEIACLIDFGLPEDEVLRSLEMVAALATA